MQTYTSNYLPNLLANANFINKIEADLINSYGRRA